MTELCNHCGEDPCLCPAVADAKALGERWMLVVDGVVTAGSGAEPLARALAENGLESLARDPAEWPRSRAPNSAPRVLAWSILLARVLAFLTLLALAAVLVGGLS